MRRVGVEEAAAIGAEHLDGDLRGHRADRDHLLGALERGRLHIGAERLRHALPHQEQRIDDADRQQDVERAAGDIDPEIADGLDRGPREAADQRHRQHDAGRGRQEVLVGQAEHLHQVGHGALAAVVLPVGVGDEAHRGVEGEVLRHRRLVGRVEVRNDRLEPQQRIENREAADVEEQHRDRVGEPMLLAPRVDAAAPIERRLDGAQHRRQRRALAVEHPRHVPAERLRQRDDDDAEDEDLKPADDCHVGIPIRTAPAAAERR